MTLTAFYPVVQTAEPRRAADFFIERLGFEETFGADWYVSLRHGAHELAFLQDAHPTIPEGYRGPASGLLLDVEVDDAAAEYRRFTEAGDVEMRLELRDEPFGQRHFIFEAPGRVLVDVIEEIPPAPEFSAAFAR
ncbi:VOC family protein [Microbacterium lushaniae]|uniref:Glyoxalase n=1 Tax=Microbacterium lushaniae TaxID=2614639 RepID=A0A5J6KZK4_9MICO|nr:VOC family protein [Microbacterium lushaniae]QEW01649.1 glyoxalase [Microbacterium lushaniae]